MYMYIARAATWQPRTGIVHLRRREWPKSALHGDEEREEAELEPRACHDVVVDPPAQHRFRATVSHGVPESVPPLLYDNNDERQRGSANTKRHFLRLRTCGE